MKCRNCNKVTEKWGNRHRYYCDLQCKAQYEKDNYKTKHIVKDVSCPVCETIFKRKTALIKYCSMDCQKLAVNIKRSQDKPSKKTCNYCQKEFKPYTSLDKYCSANCRIANQKSKRSRNWSKESCDNRSGDNNPAYKSGSYARGNKKSADGERFYKKVRNGMRAKMIEEHGYLFCEKCNTNNTYQWEMHHLIYRSEKPRHEHLHNEKNLINLCMKCHNWFHNKKSRRNEIVEQRGLTELFGQDIRIL